MKKKNSSITCFQVNTSWVVNKNGILLVDPQRGSVENLPYPEAFLWDFTCRRIPPKRQIQMTMAILKTDWRGATDWINCTLNRWIASGYLTEDNHG